MAHSALDDKFREFLSSKGFHPAHMDFMLLNLLKKAFMAGSGAVLMGFKEGHHQGSGLDAMSDMGREVEFFERNAPADHVPPPPPHAMIRQTPYDPKFDPKSETESSDPQARWGHWGGWGINPWLFNPYGYGYGGFPFGGYGYGYYPPMQVSMGPVQMGSGLKDKKDEK